MHDRRWRFPWRRVMAGVLCMMDRLNALMASILLLDSKCFCTQNASPLLLFFSMFFETALVLLIFTAISSSTRWSLVVQSHASIPSVPLFIRRIMLPVLLYVCIFFMALPDRVPGKTFRQMLFRQDLMFDNILVSENVAFQTSDIKSAIHCARSCLAHSECDSFFYNKDRQVCSGQASSLNQTSAGFSQPGSRYFKPIRQPSTSPESGEWVSVIVTVVTDRWNVTVLWTPPPPPRFTPGGIRQTSMARE